MHGETLYAPIIDDGCCLTRGAKAHGAVATPLANPRAINDPREKRDDRHSAPDAAKQNVHLLRGPRRRRRPPRARCVWINVSEASETVQSARDRGSSLEQASELTRCVRRTKHLPP